MRPFYLVLCVHFSKVLVPEHQLRHVLAVLLSRNVQGGLADLGGVWERELGLDKEVSRGGKNRQNEDDRVDGKS